MSCATPKNPRKSGNIKELETSMIGKLTGIVDTIGEDFVIVDVNGVGYLVNCSARILDQLPAKGESTTFWIETYVREDQIRLFGFSTFIEREWFRMLMTVQGVGAKVALAILGVVDASELANALALGDIASITRAPGVGKRVAERIITELKEKAPAFSDAGPEEVISAENAKNAVRSARSEAVSALVNLGYQQAQANFAIASAQKEAGEDASTEVLIRIGLKELAK